MAGKRKPSKGKKINPTLFIFCEGKTEESYINFLKSFYRIPSIHIHPRLHTRWSFVLNYNSLLLAKMLEMDRPNLHKLEKGGYSPSLYLLARIAEGLDMSLQEFLEGFK